MTQAHNGLRLALRPVREPAPAAAVAGSLPVGLLVLLGLSITLSAWFPSAGLSWWQVLPAAALFSALLWLLSLTGKGRWICAGGLVLLLLGCVVFHRQVLGGLGCLGNDLFHRLTQVTGRIHLDFAAAQDAFSLWGIATVLGAAILLLHLTLITGKLVFFLPVLLPIYAAAVFGLYPLGAGEILLCVSAVLLLLSRSGKLGAIPSWLVPTGVGVLAALALALALGNGNGQLSSWKQTLHNLRCHSASVSMPEGALNNLGSWNKSDTPALEITLSSPEKLYLRGTVYNTYTGTAWEELDPEEKSEEEDLFYWLHKSGFYGQSQIGSAMAFTAQPAAQTMTVRNLAACTDHGYYPYALYGSDSLEDDLIGDDRFPAAQSIRYLTGSVPEWYAVQHSLAGAQGRANIGEYLAGEERYRAYVTKTSLQLTRDSWSVLDRQLHDDSTAKSLGQVRALIREYLENAMIYDENVKTLNGSGDFLQYTLEKSGSGYSVHYATAATLMLRYFGIPARYVEGYFLSGEEASAYEPGQTIVLTENHAHAWAEYYLPGVGFVPFEVTPGYMDDEESRLGGSLAQDPQAYAADRLKYAQVEQPEELKEPQQDPFTFSMRPMYLAVLLALALAALVVLILGNRRRFRKQLDAIQAAPNREAIALLFGYGKALLASCPSLSQEEDPEAAALNREALFSSHTMTDAQRRGMEAYTARALERCKETWTIPQKLRYKLWDCLY